MMSKRIYVLHYSDSKIHPKLNITNLALNEVLVRCLRSIKEFSDVEATVTVVDNGSSEEAHSDTIQLLRENQLDPNMIWVRNSSHPPGTGKNAAIKDFLSTDAEQMFFTTSDTKIGPQFLSTGFSMIAGLGAKAYGEPNLCPYGIGDTKKYRTPEFWEKCKMNPEVDAQNVQAYFNNNCVLYVLDSMGEPAPVSNIECGVEAGRIGLYFANRKAVEDTGLLDASWIFGDEFCQYDQAINAGCKAHNLGAVYLCHMGSLYRSGVGCFDGDLKKMSSYKGNH